MLYPILEVIRATPQLWQQNKINAAGSGLRYGRAGCLEIRLWMANDKVDLR
jgi:hypothetical protein